MMLLLVGCLGGPPGGTAVGNPGDADLQARWADPDVLPEWVEAPVRGLTVTRCDGTERTVLSRVVLDGLGPSPEPLRVPPGRACALTIELQAPVEVAGVTAAGTGFTARLALGELPVDAEVEVDGQRLLVELDLPLTAAEIDPLGPVVELAPDDPLTVQWSAAAEVRLWEDRDEDGLVSPADAQLLWFDSGLGPDPDGSYAHAQGEECGCAAGGRPSGVLVLVGLALAAGRARGERRRGGSAARRP